MEMGDKELRALAEHHDFYEQAIARGATREAAVNGTVRYAAGVARINRWTSFLTPIAQVLGALVAGGVLWYLLRR